MWYSLQFLAIVGDVRNLKVMSLYQRFLGAQPASVVPLDTKLVTISQSHSSYNCHSLFEVKIKR